MNGKRPSRRHELAFRLGMTALLLALSPLAAVVCAFIGGDRFLAEWLWMVAVKIAFLVAPVAGMILGAASLLVRINWRGGAAIAIGACCLLAMVALSVMFADFPDR